jgi:hypothetical protein
MKNHMRLRLHGIIVLHATRFMCKQAFTLSIFDILTSRSLILIISWSTHAGWAVFEWAGGGAVLNTFRSVDSPISLFPLPAGLAVLSLGLGVDPSEDKRLLLSGAIS